MILPKWNLQNTYIHTYMQACVHMYIYMHTHTYTDIHGYSKIE